MTRKYDLPKYVCYNAASSRNLGRNDFEACLRIDGKSLKRHFTNVKDATVYVAKLMLDNSNLYSFEEISDYLTYGYEIHNEVLDDNTLKIKCSSVSDDYIEYLDELANDVCNKILIVTDCDIEYLINYENRNIIINIYNII